MSRKETPEYYHCPECDGVDILVYEETAWSLKADGEFEYFCASTKLHDYDARARCCDCNWEGIRGQLKLGSVNE